MSVPPFHILIVFIGGGLGSVARYLTTVIALSLFGPAFPWGTFTVNVLGSMLMGFLTALIVARWTPETGGTELRLFLTTGIIGGYTTFSAYTLDTFVLWERGQTVTAVVYVVSSVVLSLAVLTAAMVATRAWLA
jgi:CrcB protein